MIAPALGRSTCTPDADAARRVPEQAPDREARPPDAESAVTVHREAHGLVADEIYRVAEGA